MQLTNQQTLPVNQQQAWEALNDVTLLQAAIPGCESITATGENQYELAITAAVGPVKARFKGKLQLEELVPPTSYTMRFEGQGGAAGHGKGSAQVRLEAVGANETVLHYSANASVGGKLAQIGSRLIDMAAQKMAGDFFDTFNAKLAERYGVAVAAPAAGGGLWARFVAWLKKLFGG
ncbi:MAG: carbon monoxide dehydrogenase subunit G [Ideonella sp.]|nr:carbon monoxide dehydrogenase subunit G [Ideonella sp.]MCC7457651.1 carbon monoxide dehydrogenase subunit G [Nitrospira sp.]